MSRVLVCPVAYNENIKLKSVIERFLESCVYGKVDYLIVDDGSTDGTTEVIQGFSSRGVKTIKHPARRGVGAAIRTAIHFAQQNGYDIIVIMAGNNKDNPNEIPFLIDPIVKDGYDFVQGSRYKNGSRIGGEMPLYRRITTRLYPVFFSLVAGAKITDGSNGFRAIRLSILNHPQINLEQDWLDQYELEPYLLYKSIKLGYKYTEASVTKIYPPKKLGYTKMKPFTGWWSIFRPLIFLSLGIKR